MAIVGYRSWGRVLGVALRDCVGPDGDDGSRTSRGGWSGEELDVMALPILTPEQRQEALRLAAAARSARKQLLDAIARGEQTIPAVLDRAKVDPIVGKTK
ncbi:MAG: hypothetical protein ACRDR6_27095, partial [Pseudonocardiaceae bacterium]